MSRFRIDFEATPEVGTAPWSGRESARLKMIQSITDYLLERCACNNVSVKEIIDKPVEVAKPKASNKKKMFRAS